MKHSKTPEITQVDESQIKSTPTSPPDPEVVPRARRRQFTAKYKLRILKEADEDNPQADLGALLRREGLYHSNLSEWRRQRDKGLLIALAPKPRGRVVTPLSQAAIDLELLRRQHALLLDRLKKAELVIDVQKKVSELLGIPLQI